MAVGCACGDGVTDWKEVIAILHSVDCRGIPLVERGAENRAERNIKRLRALLARRRA